MFSPYCKQLNGSCGLSLTDKKTLFCFRCDVIRQILLWKLNIEGTEKGNCGRDKDTWIQCNKRWDGETGRVYTSFRAPLLQPPGLACFLHAIKHSLSLISSQSSNITFAGFLNLNMYSDLSPKAQAMPTAALESFSLKTPVSISKRQQN